MSSKLFCLPSKNVLCREDKIAACSPDCALNWMLNTRRKCFCRSLDEVISSLHTFEGGKAKCLKSAKHGAVLHLAVLVPGLRFYFDKTRCGCTRYWLLESS